MSRPSLHSFGFGLLAILPLFSPTDATTASNWTNPDARLPSFSSTYLVGEKIYLSWQPLNQSTDDLWLIRYDTSNKYSLRIATTLDISQANSFPWTIAVPEEEVQQDTRFLFAFVPTGSTYDAAADSGLDSPAFNLMMVNQATPPNGTVSASSTNLATPTATATTNSSSVSPVSPTSSPDSHHRHDLSSTKIAGIAVGVILAVGLACAVAAFWIYKKRKSRHVQNVPANSDVLMTGPYEALGSSRSPSELNTKEIQVHELTSSQETLAHESDSTPVHEVGNTVKRPGLHEMPG